MAKVIPIGQPMKRCRTRIAIAHLRDHLPDSYRPAGTTSRLERQGERFEIDIGLAGTPHALYLIDVKGTRGSIDVLRSPSGIRKAARLILRRWPSCAGHSRARSRV
jgi:hypothetical protein